jgi:hypothetical protein
LRKIACAREIASAGKKEGVSFMMALRRRRRRQHHQLAPALENLEDRQLLSVYTGPSMRRTVQSSGGTFLIQVSGPGVIKENPAGRSGIDLSAFGTTSATTITITQIRPRWHFPSQYLDLNNVKITSGQLGGFDASFSELTGKMTPLNSALNTLELGSIGPKAQIVVNGSVGTMSVAQVDLGPTGRVMITGQLNSSDATSSTSPSALTDLTGLMTIGNFTIDGGQFVIGQDSIAPIAVTGNMTISHDGLFSIGRDLDQSLTINGNLVLDTGGQIFVGRNLNSLSVNGNVIVNPSGSGIVVNGALGDLSVSGIFQGQGGTSTPTLFDLGVGLNIGGLSISGGTTSQEGLINANIRAGGSITGENIIYGNVNSTIQPNTPPPS